MNVKGMDGNTLTVLGSAVTVLNRAGMRNEARLLRADVLNAKSYTEALALIGQRVEMTWGEVKTASVGEDELPEGQYVIADPCYVFNDETYYKLLADEHFDSGKPATFGNGYQCWIVATTHGDGTFPDQDGREYAVDSAHLAIISTAGEAHFKKGWVNETILVMPKPFSVERTDKGVIRFGDKIEIETDGHWCEECEGRAEYCECDECGECNQYCSCSDKDEDEDDE